MGICKQISTKIYRLNFSNGLGFFVFLSVWKNEAARPLVRQAARNTLAAIFSSAYYKRPPEGRLALCTSFEYNGVVGASGNEEQSNSEVVTTARKQSAWQRPIQVQTDAANLAGNRG